MAKADVKTEQEPSIEEILNSIRQIISDDGDAGSNPAAAGKARQDKPAQQAAAAPSSLSASASLSSSPARDFSPPPSSSPPDLAFEQISAPAAPPDTDILDLTEKLNPDPALAIELMDKPMTMEKPMTDNPNGLMSAQTADAATQALSKLLAGSLVIEKDEIGRTGKVTLEDLTCDLMKPMLKVWLDQNLPAIIEKIVQKEVEKLSRRAMDR